MRSAREELGHGSQQEDESRWENGVRKELEEA